MLGLAIDERLDLRARLAAEKLRAGDATPVRRFEFGTALPEGFVFSPDGRHLYGSSYYPGGSKVYRY